MIYSKDNLDPLPRVVVVNDDVTQLNILCKLLSKAGLDPLAFKSAETALAAMGQDSLPALIVTDLYMPGIDGWRFCRLLRSPEYSSFNPVPILVVSAIFSGDEPSRITSDLGANAFLPLPVDGDRFIEKTLALLKGEKPQDVLKVLIVDDDQLISAKLVKAFQAHGYLADAAFTYQEGLALMGQSAYDVAVLAYHLPDVRGDALVKDLQEKSPECVCILMTSDPQPELAQTWMKMGVAAYLQKPFEPEHLIAQCERARRERAMLRVEDLLEMRTRQLQESEEKYRGLVQYSSDPIFAFNPDETYRFVNEAFARAFGKKPEEIIGKTPHAVFSSEEAEKRLALVRRVFNSGETGEIEGKVITHTGEERYYLTRADPVKDEQGEILYITCTAKDTTERKRAEEELRHLTQFNQEVVSGAAEGIVVYDRKLRYLVWNSFMEFLTGVPLDDVLGKCALDVFPHLREQGVDRLLERALAGESVRSQDTPFYSPVTGRSGWVVGTYAPHRNGNGNVIGVIAIINDITERRQTEEALRKSEYRYRALFEQAPDGVVILNPQTGQFIEFNDQACRQLGYTREEFGRLRVADIEVVESAEEVQSHIQKIWCEGHDEFETRQRTRQGEIRNIQVTAQVIDAGKNPIYHCIWRDITERKLAEAKINEQLEELRRWHTITLGREDRILELKREVNRLLTETGKPPRYASAAEAVHE